MFVLATAGHVDHGKSTLVRALTGTDPDRLAEEKRRGLTIELGFAWTALSDGTEIAFVDVPGHQRFLATTVAGMGPVPAVLFVVAADQGWRRQSGEHLAALDALGVSRGLLVITRSDLADPGDAATHALSAMEETSLAGLSWLGVSAKTGQGLDRLRTALAELTAALPAPDPTARVRLWVDRSFTIVGTGTVVTGTLGAGTVGIGDTLQLGGEPVTVRSIQSLDAKREQVSGTARVALALRGVDRSDVGRGDALLTPGRWRSTAGVDARITRPGGLPRQAVLHIGSAHVPAQVRQLSDTHVRLTLERPLPLEIGDRALLRDPGAQRVVAGLVVVDTDPPPFHRRGAAASRATELSQRGDHPDPVTEVGRRGMATRAELSARGILTPDTPLPAGLVERAGYVLTHLRWHDLQQELVTSVVDAPTGIPREQLRSQLGLPTATLLDALLGGTALTSRAGRIIAVDAGPPRHLREALQTLERLWADDPLHSPDTDQLRAARLDHPALGALADGGHLTRLSREIVVGPAGPGHAHRILLTLPQPFSVSAARAALGSTRRVVVPLLEYLDRHGVTRRLADGLRTTRNRP